MLRFYIEIENPKLIEKLEQAEDTVFYRRLQTLIVEELQKYSKVTRDDVSVKELTPAFSK